MSDPFPGTLHTDEELREIIPWPGPRAAAKEIYHLDANCRAFIAHSPFVLIGTTNADGTGDVSPKGGPPGFVRVLDDHRLALGELPGNGRVDSYRNVIENPAVGLLFLIPGIGETMRVNGQGYVSTDPDLLDECAIDGRRPKLVLGVRMQEAFIHCAKALRRGQLWRPEGWPDTSDMPTVSCMLVDHVGIPDDPGGHRLQAALEDAYAKTMWN